MTQQARILHAAARGARIQIKNGFWNPNKGCLETAWQDTSIINIEYIDEYRIHPSTALRGRVVNYPFDGLAYDHAMSSSTSRFGKWWYDLSYTEYMTTPLFLAEFLADQGV